MDAHGCASLVANAGTTVGCPYAEGNTEQLRGMLLWADVSIPDIEDIVAPRKFAQDQCARDFQTRRSPGKSLLIKHPNQFMRGSAATRQRAQTKIESGEPGKNWFDNNNNVTSGGGGGERADKRPKLSK